jgi:prepilin-type N-terminal cleavage/methylation domain-containing protein
MMCRTPPRTPQRGLSLVELMVGMTVGLLVMAGAVAALADQLGHARHAVLQARLQQDLRAASLLIERGLRRAGGWPQALAHTAQPVQDNPNRGLSVASDQRSVVYHHGATEALEEQAQGFRLTQQVLYSRLGPAGWQALTDRQTLRITRLQFEPVAQSQTAAHACLQGCEGGACPNSAVRAVHYRIEAQGAPPNSHLRHAVQGTVHVRNDDVTPARCL